MSLPRRMNVQPIRTPHFGYDGRGPELVRWIHDRELVLPGSDQGRAPLPGGITGAQHTEGWIIFQGLQVVQTAPEEVHSYWFFELLAENAKHTGAYRVTDSTWKASFHQRHLANQRHFILVFYDHLVELLCRELVFGAGEFRIADHPRLSYYDTWYDDI